MARSELTPQKLSQIHLTMRSEPPPAELIFDIISPVVSRKVNAVDLQTNASLQLPAAAMKLVLVIRIF